MTATPPTPACAALLYAPDGYDTSRPRLMGRHAAGEGFLGGMVRHAGFATGWSR